MPHVEQLKSYSANAYPEYSRNWIILDKVRVEAGFVDNPDDRGGPTKGGITEVEARAWGYEGDMRELDIPTIFQIYVDRFWNRLGLDKMFDLHPLMRYVADMVFDFGINSGRSAAGKWLQNYLNICNKKGTLYKDLVVDGVVGAATYTTLNTYVQLNRRDHIQNMLFAIITWQGAHWQKCAINREKNETFVMGWLNRGRESMAEFAEAVEHGL